MFPRLVIIDILEGVFDRTCAFDRTSPLRDSIDTIVTTGSKRNTECLPEATDSACCTWENVRKTTLWQTAGVL